ncbi:hypothetical protein N2599_11420 [Rhizobium sullae]|uniref:Uncharacterized protein n=1 Tax=Rhizobium sullae TaxID=50338 RepID=A0ABY5XE20_RHISU|nr:CrpP-related protein [Rhizobium sullae]UWU12785.1 hypothetical protein N2599_11420 [Rhizobium sullae]
MTIEELIDLQEAGSRARVLGLASHENPYLKPGRTPTKDTIALEDWIARHDAWKFGWEAENASREGKIVSFFSNIVRPNRRQVLG